MKYLEKIQNLLPLGYLYLIILGLLKEGILYYQLGINILNYSSITDILISPISDMAASPALIGVAISVFVLIFTVQFFLVRYSQRNWVKKIIGVSRFTPETTKKDIQKVIFPFFALIMAFELLSVFIGLGLGKGHKLKKSIINNDFKCNYRIDFSSGKTQDVYLFDSNSSFYFYVTKGNKNIKIASAGTINNLELIINDKLK